MKLPLCLSLLAVSLGATVRGPQINSDLPRELQVKNHGGSDGARASAVTAKAAAASANGSCRRCRAFAFSVAPS